MTDGSLDKTKIICLNCQGGLRYHQSLSSLCFVEQLAQSMNSNCVQFFELKKTGQFVLDCCKNNFDMHLHKANVFIWLYFDESIKTYPFKMPVFHLSPYDSWARLQPPRNPELY